MQQFWHGELRQRRREENVLNNVDLHGINCYYYDYLFTYLFFMPLSVTVWFFKAKMFKT